jgi:ligand-binding sensor domain-containing protein
METLCLEEDAEDSIWIGTREAGLYQVQRRLLTTRHLPTEADQSSLVTVCAARNGIVWGGTDGEGVFRWRGGEVTRFGLDQGLSDLRVTVLLEDRHTNFWAGTYGGAFEFKGGKFQPVAGPAALHGATFALLDDRRGRLWAGTRSGLVCLEEGRATVYADSEGLPSGPVCALAEDRDRRIWVAITGGGCTGQLEGATNATSRKKIPLAV